jgi:hypothetical protein
MKGGRTTLATSDLEKISRTIQRLATTEMKPKKLFKAVREEHPDASRKEIVRAAFLAVIDNSDANPEKSVQLQNFALSERGGDLTEGPSEADVTPADRPARSRARKIKLVGNDAGPTG